MNLLSKIKNFFKPSKQDIKLKSLIRYAEFKELNHSKKGRFITFTVSDRIESLVISLDTVTLTAIIASAEEPKLLVIFLTSLEDWKRMINTYKHFNSVYDAKKGALAFPPNDPDMIDYFIHESIEK